MAPGMKFILIVLLVSSLLFPATPGFADVNGMCTDELIVGRNRDAGADPDQDMRWSVISDSAGGFATLNTAGTGWGGFRDTTALAAGDLDGDGLDEIIVGRDGAAGQSVRYWVYDDADQGFLQLQEGGQDWGASRRVTAIAVGNVDDDDRMEFAVGRTGPTGFRYRIYDDRLANFEALHTGGSSWPNDRDVTSLAFGDLDGDGLDELVVGRTGGNQQRPRWIVVDDETQGFAELIAEGQGWGEDRSTSAVATGDFDGDGLAEIAIGRSAGGNFRIQFRDDATTGFAVLQSAGQSFGNNRGVTAIAAGDVDADGIDEVIFGLNPGGGFRAMLLDDALQDFSVMQNSDGDQMLIGTGWGNERGVSELAFGDVDGDFADEFVIGRNAGGNERWFIHDDRFGDFEVLSSEDSWGNDRGVTAVAFRARRPSGRDRDQDGIFDDWEVNGIDVDCQNGPDLVLQNADPDRKNVYVEMDFMQNHQPDPDAIQDVIDAFAGAPPSVGNADGSAGVILVIDVDEQIPEQLDIATWADFDTIRAAQFGTPAERAAANGPQILAAKALVYRYALMAHTRDGGTSSGRAKRGNIVVTLGGSPWGADPADPSHNVGTRAQQAGTIMHELGHTLGLRHGGNEGTNCKPNYLSVMNYSFQTRLIPNPGLPGPRLDYSRSALPDLDESALSEGVGIQDGTDNTFWGNDGMNRLTAPGMGPINWNGTTNPDGTPLIDPGTVGADINFTPTTACTASPNEVLGGFDDWASLSLAMRSSTGDPADEETYPDDELTGEDAVIFESCAENEDTARCLNPPFEYAAKFVCGRQDDPETLRLVRGVYGTTVNIHSPWDRDSVFYKKVAITYPPAEQRAGEILQMGKDLLRYDEALKVDCEDIRARAFQGSFPTPYVEGFVVVQSFESLDVTAVYTTAAIQNGAGGCCGDGRGEQIVQSGIEVMQVRERLKSRRPPPPLDELPDLTPLPFFPPPQSPLPEGFPETNFCGAATPTGGAPDEIRFVARNIGAAAAEQSTAQVTFTGSPPVEVPVAPLPIDSGSVRIVSIPRGCYGPTFNDRCSFTIELDAPDEVEEGNESNNTAEGFCVNPAG